MQKTVKLDSGDIFNLPLSKVDLRKINKEVAKLITAVEANPQDEVAAGRLWTLEMVLNESAEVLVQIRRSQFRLIIGGLDG